MTKREKRQERAIIYNDSTGTNDGAPAALSLGETSSGLSSTAETPPVEEVVENNDWFARNYEEHQRIRRRLRLQHATAAVVIAVASSVVGVYGGAAAAGRVLVFGALTYFVVSVFSGLTAQWKREYNLDTDK